MEKKDNERSYIKFGENEETDGSQIEKDRFEEVGWK